MTTRESRRVTTEEMTVRGGLVVGHGGGERGRVRFVKRVRKSLNSVSYS